jgi:hypothetical protein
MGLTRLVYVSRPLGYDPLELDDILHVSRALNARSGITGALISRWDLFLQLLEGSAGAVAETYERIRRDRRHVAVTLLGTAEAPLRLFPDWRMRHDVAPGWVWSHEAVLAGAHRSASFADSVAMFERFVTE